MDGVENYDLKGKRWGRLAAWLAILFGAASFLMGVFTIPLAIANQGPVTSYTDPSWILAISFAIVGMLVALRNPRHSMGWIYLAIALCYGICAFGLQYATYALITHPGSRLPFSGAFSVLSQITWVPGLDLMLTFALLLFPNGKPPSRGWRIVVWLSAIPLLAFVVIAAWAWQFRGATMLTNQSSIDFSINTPFIQLMFNGAFPSLLVCGLLSVISLIYRYRHSSGITRQQLKWFTFAAAFLFVAIILNTLSDDFLPNNHLADFLMLPFVPAIPVAAGIAILRYRLFDIDVIIRRTLVYAMLTATLAAVYFGGVLLLQGLFRLATGQTSPLALVVSTLAIAALFNPLRRRLQERIDYRFYRKKYDAARAVETFASTLRQEVDLERMTSDLVRVVDETVQPDSVALWMRTGARR